MQEEFGHDTNKFMNKPNVIYMKIPRNRILFITKTVD